MWERAKASRHAYSPLLHFLFHLVYYILMTFICILSFLVDACMKLLAHVDTEGLFRKSGSVIRLKALRVSDGCKLTLHSPKDLDPEKGLTQQFFVCVCLSRQNWTRVRSACPLHFPVTWPVWWSSSSGSYQSRCCPRSCRRPFSRPSSSPPCRIGPLPPCCCLVYYPTETWAFCVTFLTSSTTCLRGTRVIFSWIAVAFNIICKQPSPIKDGFISLFTHVLIYYCCFSFCLITGVQRIRWIAVTCL